MAKDRELVIIIENGKPVIRPKEIGNTAKAYGKYYNGGEDTVISGYIMTNIITHSKKQPVGYLGIEIYNFGVPLNKRKNNIHVYFELTGLKKPQFKNYDGDILQENSIKELFPEGYKILMECIALVEKYYKENFNADYEVSNIEKLFTGDIPVIYTTYSFFFKQQKK